MVVFCIHFKCIFLYQIHVLLVCGDGTLNYLNLSGPTLHPIGHGACLTTVSPIW